jgi:hypothetical protein
VIDFEAGLIYHAMQSVALGAKPVASGYIRLDDEPAFLEAACPGNPPIAPPRPLGAVPARRGRLAFHLFAHIPHSFAGMPAVSATIHRSGGIDQRRGSPAERRWLKHYTLCSNLLHTSATAHTGARGVPDLDKP